MADEQVAQNSDLPQNSVVDMWDNCEDCYAMIQYVGDWGMSSDARLRRVIELALDILTRTYEPDQFLSYNGKNIFSGLNLWVTRVGDARKELFDAYTDIQMKAIWDGCTVKILKAAYWPPSRKRIKTISAGLFLSQFLELLISGGRIKERDVADIIREHFHVPPECQF